MEEIDQQLLNVNNQAIDDVQNRMNEFDEIYQEILNI